MDLVNEFELVSLELVAGEDAHHVVLADKLEDFLGHFQVALDIVGAVKRAGLVHIAQDFYELAVGFLQRLEIEANRRHLLPAFKLEQLQDMRNAVLLIEHFAFGVGVALEDFANDGEVLDEFLREGLLAELGEAPSLRKLVEVVQVHASVVKVNHRLHRVQMDLRKNRVGRLRMLDILLLEVFQFVDEVLLPPGESVDLEVVVVHTLLNVEEDVQELLLAIEVILIHRVYHLICDTIDLNEVILHALEDHRAENVLIVRFGFAAWDFKAFDEFENSGENVGPLAQNII
mmetsp:Transcript_9949/g.12412  ORF Transcript_9949/g.12412 Transcript_9949/m.12412 type:complete len:288 (-) Transcript_9949:175-1038(-)